MYARERSPGICPGVNTAIHVTRLLALLVVSIWHPCVRDKRSMSRKRPLTALCGRPVSGVTTFLTTIAARFPLHSLTFGRAIIDSRFRLPAVCPLPFRVSQQFPRPPFGPDPVRIRPHCRHYARLPLVSDQTLFIRTPVSLSDVHA